MYANFLLGSLSVTEAAQQKLQRHPLDLIARHAVNDHGNVFAHEARKNTASMRNCGQLVSRFPVDPNDASQGNVLVITTESWDSTTVQLESE